MEALFDFFTWLWAFLTTGIFDFVTAAFASLVEWLIVMKLESMLWTLKFAWGIAKSVLENLQISQLLDTAWAGLDSATMSALMFFRVPEALNLMISALMTRFVLRFLPVSL